MQNHTEGTDNGYKGLSETLLMNHCEPSTSLPALQGHRDGRVAPRLCVPWESSRGKQPLGKPAAFSGPIFTTSLLCVLAQCPLHSVGTSVCWLCLHPVQRDTALLSIRYRGGTKLWVWVCADNTESIHSCQALCADPLRAPAVVEGRNIPAAGLRRSQGCESSLLCSMGFLSPSPLWHSLPSLTAFSPQHNSGHSCPPASSPGRSQILPPPSNIFFP